MADQSVSRPSRKPAGVQWTVCAGDPTPVTGRRSAREFDRAAGAIRAIGGLTYPRIGRTPLGTLMLGRIVSIDLPDDVLAHVHAVIIAKLRVREPVIVGWVADGGRHDEVMVNPTMPVLAQYDDDGEPRLDRRWLNRLMMAANAVRGLQLTPELVEALRAIEGDGEGESADAAAAAAESG
jgi:hypothetical protein